MLIGVLASTECTVVLTGVEPELGGNSDWKHSVLGGSHGADTAPFPLFSHSLCPCSDIPSLNNFTDVCILSFTYKF